MQSETHIDIRRTVSRVADVPFAAIAKHILGKRYTLSLTLCGDALARRMYLTHRKSRIKGEPDRGPSYASNVLSFPYASTEGEIFLNVRKAEREAKALGITTKKRVALLLVHGCFHLKGYQHGDTMERLERSVLRTFDLD
jgi:rRNA maturation RNase YbeY